MIDSQAADYWTLQTRIKREIGMRKGMHVMIYKPADGFDGTNGGVTSKAGTALITGAVLMVERHGAMLEKRTDMETIPEVFEDDGTYPVLRIERRMILKECPGCGDNAHSERWPYVVAVPAGELSRRPMFGGNFIYSTDSRFGAISLYPVPVHDRYE